MDSQAGNLLGGGTTDNSAVQAGGSTSIPATPQSGGMTPIPAAPVTGGSTPIPAGGVTPVSGGSGGSWYSPATNWLGNQSVGSLAKDVSPLIAGGGLINAVAGGTGKIPQKGNIANVAGQTMASGQQEVNQANAGQLPPGQEAALEQQLADQIQQIKAKYAGMGLAGSTMEQQEIQGLQNQMQAQKQQEVQSYLTQGLNTENTAGADYAQLGQLQMQQQQGMSAAIANFLKAMGGSAPDKTAAGG